MHIQYYVLVHPPRTRNCTETESLTHSLLYVSVPFLRLLFRRTCWAVGRGRRHRCRRLFDSLHGHAPNPNISSLTPCMICTVLVNEGNMICVPSRALISKSIRVDHSDTVIQVCETACTSNTACMSLSLSLAGCLLPLHHLNPHPHSHQHQHQHHNIDIVFNHQRLSEYEQLVLCTQGNHSDATLRERGMAPSCSCQTPHAYICTLHSVPTSLNSRKRT